MLIDLNNLKNIYNELNEEQKESQDITCFEDFRGYIVGLILSNLQYDFNIDVDYDDLFIEED